MHSTLTMRILTKSGMLLVYTLILYVLKHENLYIELLSVSKICKNMDMKACTTTDSKTTILLGIKVFSVKKYAKRHAVIKNPWNTMGISTNV